MTINIVNAALVVFLFWDTGGLLFLTLWSASVALEATAAFWARNRARKNPPTGASARGVRRMALHAAFLGATWGAAAVVLFPHADTMHQLFLAGLMAGMVSGGAFGGKEFVRRPQ